MKISTFGYSIKQGLKNIRRNLLFSLASVGTIVACLFLFGIFYTLVLNIYQPIFYIFLKFMHIFSFLLLKFKKKGSIVCVLTN